MGGARGYSSLSPCLSVCKSLQSRLSGLENELFVTLLLCTGCFALQETLNHLFDYFRGHKSWIDTYLEINDTEKPVVCVLGNKADLLEERQVSMLSPAQPLNLAHLTRMHSTTGYC